MSVLHGCSLCKPADFIKSKIKENKKTFLTYSIFFVLIIEWITGIYLNFFHVTTEKITDIYIVKIAPFSVNLIAFILMFSLFLWQDRLHFCFRKSATTFYLSCYYLFNVIAVAFCLNAYFYYNIVAYIFLSIATFLFFVSLINKKQ